ncbi:MAG: hypothetical protein RSA98_04900 [Odoribacter sp.]
MKNSWIIITIIAVICNSCNDHSARLKAVLKYSGENRKELEKVIAYYSQDPADKLKLQSAIFLIENMPGHYTYGGSFMKNYCDQVDTLKHTPYYEKKLIQTVPFHYTQYKKQLELQEDVKVIQADFLIHQIEIAFKQWQNAPWLKDLDFENFKEYLLPYRVENEPLDDWRDAISDFQPELGDYTKYYDDCRHSIYKMSHQFYRYVPSIEAKIPNPDMKDFKIECIPISKLNLFTLRTLGLPSAIDFIPHYSNRNGRHYWATVIDLQVKAPELFQTGIYSAGKIYRRTFSHNKTAKPAGKEYIPPFFQDPFNKDVTDLYLPTTDVTLKIPGIRKINHAYLAVFNDLTWKPIACTQVSGNKITFSNMGKGSIYLPVYYDETEEMHPLAPPFILFNNGKIQTLNLRKDSLQKGTFTRKYPINSMNNYWNDELTYSQFEASNRSDFKHPDTLFRITQKTNYQYQFIKVDTNLKRRYWRFISAKTSGSFLADLRFYDNQHQEQMGKIIDLDSKGASLLFDDDPLTMTIVKQVKMDFEKPVAFSQIRYLGRNDGNGIYSNNKYELFYYDFPNGWHSMGIKKAKDDHIIYDDLPTGGLYWLRNLTTGKEERIFTLTKGQIRFW